MRRRARQGFELGLTEALQAAHEDDNYPGSGSPTANRKPRRGIASRPIPCLYTVPEAATVLRLSVRTVRRLIAQKKIASVHIGRAVRVREEALRALIDGE